MNKRNEMKQRRWVYLVAVSLGNIVKIHAQVKQETGGGGGGTEAALIKVDLSPLLQIAAISIALFFPRPWGNERMRNCTRARGSVSEGAK